MSFNKSAGVVGREFARDARAVPQIGFVGGAVISSDRGPIETTITSQDQFISRYGKPTSDNPSKFSVMRFLRTASQITVRRVITDSTEAEATVGGTSPDNVVTIKAENPGTWGNNISVKFNENTDSGGSPTGLWTIEVSFNSEIVETFTVSFEVDAVDGFGNTQYIEDVINSRSIFIYVEHDPSVTNDITDGDTGDLTGGTDDTTPVSSTEVVAGLGDFRNKEEIDLDYLINAGWTDGAVHAEMVSVVEQRKDAVAILDAPNVTVASDLVDFRNNDSNVNSTFAALYAGWLKILDSFSGKEMFIPPSGDVAGIFASNQQILPWLAPAGLRRGVINGVIGTNKVWSEAERDILYPAGLNPIQTFPGQGTVVWGQKTQSAIANSLDRVNVRFLFNFIRETAVEALQPFVFQANTQFTRNSIFSLLDNFMSNIRANDGVFDYQIVVDRSNNTDFVIENNQLEVDILIQPVRTAEFIRVDTISVPLSQDLS